MCPTEYFLTVTGERNSSFLKIVDMDSLAGQGICNAERIYRSFIFRNYLSFTIIIIINNNT